MEYEFVTIYLGTLQSLHFVKVLRNSSHHQMPLLMKELLPLNLFFAVPYWSHNPNRKQLCIKLCITPIQVWAFHLKFQAWFCIEFSVIWYILTFSRQVLSNPYPKTHQEEFRLFIHIINCKEGLWLSFPKHLFPQ
jgi:hypothetical protein